MEGIICSDENNMLTLHTKMKYMGTNIVETIQTRLDAMGMSQAQFAESVSATPAQMSIFLRGKGVLSTNSLNKSLDLVGINLSIFSKRNCLAKKIATYLRSKNVSSIENWTKNELATFTNEKIILLLFDVHSKEDYVNIEKSGIIDIESTYPYFKALVSYYMTLTADKPTASQAKQALVSMFNESDEEFKLFRKMATGVAIGAGAIAFASPILGSVLAAASVAASKQVGAFTLFTKSKASLFSKARQMIK